MEDRKFEALYPFKSRFEEIEKILKLVKEGNSVQLVGLPGTGRSNILGHLSYNRGVRMAHLGENQGKFHFVWVNFSEIRKKPFSDTIKYFFVSLVDSLRERKMSKEYAQTEKLLKDSLRFGDEMILSRGLKKSIEYLALERDLTLVFLIDRFEEYVPSLTPDFFTLLRSIRNRVKYKFSAVFSLNRPLDEILEKEFYEDFYEFLEGNIVYLSLMDEPSLFFRIKHLESLSGQKVPKTILEEILSLTRGHGKLTRICIEAYFSAQDTASQYNNFLDFLLSKNRVKGVLLEIWKALTPEEQKLLALKEKRKEESLKSDFLEKVGLIKDDKLTIPLLEMFINSNKQELERATIGKIIFDPERNEIKRGEMIVSEALTKLEFKLLRYLIQNPEKILERDELINAVWGELASTTGVTDQALDQLIFRLRKKIEEDPNSPVHVQTVKGRGIKFSP